MVCYEWEVGVFLEHPEIKEAFIRRMEAEIKQRIEKRQARKGLFFFAIIVRCISSRKAFIVWSLLKSTAFSQLNA